MRLAKKTLGFFGLLGMLLALSSCGGLFLPDETTYPCKFTVHNYTSNPDVTIESVEYTLAGEENWTNPRLYDSFLEPISNIEDRAFFYLKDPANYDFKFLDKDGNVIGVIVEDKTVVERTGNSLVFYVYNDHINVW